MKERYYMSDLRWWVEHGDAAETLRVLPDGSVVPLHSLFEVVVSLKDVHKILARINSEVDVSKTNLVADEIEPRIK
jgi:hypothetical protein